MIEAITIEPPVARGSTPGASVAGGTGRRVARYELSEPLRAFLRAKYLRDDAAAVPGGAATAVSTPLWNPSADPTHASWRHVRTALKLLALGLAAVLFVLLALVPEARADSVMLAESGLLVGVGEQSDTFSFLAPGAGTLDVRLSDLDWPSPLANLSLDITSASQVLGTLGGAGEQDFTLGSAGTYYLHLTGKANGLLDIGAYGLLALFEPAVAPVPLPASVTLLFGGLVATAWSLRRRGADSPAAQ